MRSFFFIAFMLIYSVVTSALRADTDAASAWEPDNVVQRPLARLRSGPGPIFPVVQVIRRGTLVTPMARSNDRRWIKVANLRARKGGKICTIKTFGPNARPWLAARDLTPGRRRKKRPFAVATDREIQVAAASVAACIHGFDDKVLNYLSARHIAKKKLDSILETPFGIGEYERFRTARLGRKWFRAVPSPLDVPNDFLSAVQMDRLAGMVGAELSEKLGGRLCRDKGKRAYVAMVGTLLGEASPRYDVRFRFVLLEGEIPNSFSAPGGIIVVTTGLLKMCRDESELAAVLGHEIGHVVLQHGLRNREKTARRIGIDTEGLMKDLSDVTRTPPEMKKVQDQLNTMAQQFLSATLMKERRIREELEADKVSLYLLARARYDTGALLIVVSRIPPRSRVQEFELRVLRNHPAMKQRLVAIKKATQKYRKYHGRRYRKLYLSHVGPGRQGDSPAGTGKTKNTRNGN